MNCVSGKLLAINLTNCSTSIYTLEEDLIHKFLGGRALGGKLLYDNLTPNVDPLGPENKLFVLTGPVTGTIVPNAGKYVVITKSPLTNAFLDTYASGDIAPELKFAGWDGLLISGKAEKPMYLWIVDGKVEFRDAKHLWGKNTIDTEDRIKSETSAEAGIMVIGPAGENLVRFASINSDHYRQAGRGGAGAVMGSKNLKGIAVLGHGGLIPYDAQGLRDQYLQDLAKLRASAVGQARKKYGTPMTLNITNKAGMLPVRNFQASTMPEAVDQIDAHGVEKMTIKSKSCWGCMIGCSKITKTPEGPYKGDIVDGPEYETLGMLGSNLGVTYLPAIIRANILCDTLGLDTMSTGAVISFIMECYARGFLTEQEIGLANPEFGNHEAALALIELIAERKGSGDTFAEGVQRLAKHIGKNSDKFAMNVKGMEFPAYDPRAGFGMCLSYAVSARGACHRRAWPPAKEVLGGVPPFTTEGKAEMVKNLSDENTILHSILVCDFPGKFVPLGIDRYAQYLSDVTGIPFIEEDLWKIAARGETQIRMFNCREGFTRADDTLPDRIFEESLPDGANRGHAFTRTDLDCMLDDYYTLRGWDLQGNPFPETISQLGLTV